MHKGQVVAKEFMLQQLIREEAFGESWRALELNAGRIVRIFFPFEPLRSDPALPDRLRSHLVHFADFTSPCLVPLDRVVETPEDGILLVFRHVEGPTLDDYALQWIRLQGQFPSHLLHDLLQPVALLLDQAAEQGFSHRRLTPHRIVVSSTEGVRILGFETIDILAGMMGQHSSFPIPESEENLRYLAPEQIRGGEGTPLSDQYALAMIAGELLLGRPLFVAPRVDELRTRLLTASPPLLPDQLEHVNDALQRALQKDPRNRFSSSSEFLDCLTGKIPFTMNTFPSQDFPILPSEPLTPEELGLDDLPVSEDSVLISPSEPGTSRGSTFLPLVEERDDSFAAISTEAAQVSAERVAGKMRRDRRFQKMFYVWNILVLVGCVIALIVYNFRKPESRRAGGKAGHLQAGSEDEGDWNPRRRTSRGGSGAAVDFNGNNDSPFRSIPGSDAADEVRFIGTRGTGEKFLFVIDASAPMGNGKHSPWEYVRGELKFSFEDLRDTQQFQVVYFNAAANLLPGGDAPGGWIPATPEKRKEAYEYLQTLKTDGQGDPALALQTALDLEPDVIFFLTDKKCVPLETTKALDLITLAGGTKINVVEIGEGPDPPRGKPAIRALAESCRGSYKWVNGNLHSLAR